MRWLASAAVLTLLLTVMLTLAVDFHQSSDYALWEMSFGGSGGHPVVDFAVYDGKLYAAADSSIYVYDGGSWAVVDAGFYVTSVEPYAGNLIVGGHGGLYWLDNSTFTLIFTVPTYIKVLGVYNDTLYAGTYLDNPPTLYYCSGSAGNASNWHVDADFANVLNFSGAFGSIDSLAEYNGHLYVASGGAVHCLNATGWSTVKTFDDVCAVLAMRVYDSRLHVATRDLSVRRPEYQAGTGFSGRIIAYDETGWATILDHDYWMFSLEAYGDTLYAGTANRVFTYNGAGWGTSFDAEEASLYVTSLVYYDYAIFAGMGNGSIYRHPGAATANLAPSGSPSSAYRWLDAADQAYATEYRGSYNYSQATVTVTYFSAGATFSGQLVAWDLKPNFAYQLKLVGESGTPSNEQIGLAGRWWQEEWNGSAWANGHNLNNKGNGSSPNPNDLVYFARRFIEDPSSPTGYHYRYTGYLLFAYFITDETGGATIGFETGRCCHVLWKTSQRSPTSNDGPVQTAVFDPDPAQPAYDVDYPNSTVSIFGEWERLPMGDVHLAPGPYACHITLTEESFHGTAPLAGNWATAIDTAISFEVTG